MNLVKLSNKKRRILQKRRCRFCQETTITIDYKDVKLLGHFITERGKIIPRRISGNCAKHQRVVMLQVKRARQIALLPFVDSTV